MRNILWNCVIWFQLSLIFTIKTELSKTKLRHTLRDVNMSKRQSNGLNGKPGDNVDLKNIYRNKLTEIAIKLLE